MNPFYLMAPRSFLYPLVAIATVADRRCVAGCDLRRVLADSHSASSFGLQSARVDLHTSRSEMGQIYIPEVNGALHDRLPRASWSASGPRPRSAERTASP